ncbi:MAG: histidine kinase [Chitinophagaceae bacterium]|nr:histidine kinase [Chitinophagaceae bacterium]
MKKERKRIAYDLHDELGPVLASIKMNLMSLQVDAAEQEIVDRSCKRIDDIVHNMRSISYDLLPVTLQRKGLQAAVDELLGRPEVRKHLHPIIEIDKEIHFEKEKEIHLFRIIQEVVHNTIKHAKAKTFRIVLKKHHKKFILVLEDDGVGFDSAKKRITTDLD